MDFHEDVLSERYAASVLRFMYFAEGKVKYNDLKPIVNNFPTLEKLMNNLSDAGLVILDRVMKPYKTNFATLTDLGWRVSKKLVMASQILNGETPEAETNHGSSSEEGGAILNGDKND